MTSTEVPSPVKVTRHTWETEEMKRESSTTWRRFSSNFVSPSPHALQQRKTDKETEDKEKEVLSHGVCMLRVYVPKDFQGFS